MTVLCTNEDHDEDVPAIFDVSFPDDYWKPCKACRDCLEIIFENLLDSPTACLIAPVATPENTSLSVRRAGLLRP